MFCKPYVRVLIFDCKVLGFGFGGFCVLVLIVCRLDVSRSIAFRVSYCVLK